jgi:hypothetical protein
MLEILFVNINGAEAISQFPMCNVIWAKIISNIFYNIYCMKRIWKVTQVTLKVKNLQTFKLTKQMY